MLYANNAIQQFNGLMLFLKLNLFQDSFTQTRDTICKNDQKIDPNMAFLIHMQKSPKKKAIYRILD